MTFTFKEIPSQDMGVKIITMSGVQRAPCEPQITSIPGRYNPLILEKQERQTTEITAELLVECPDNIRNIFSWLLGRGKLIFSDEPDKYYNVISDDVISIQRIDDRIQSFEIKFICEPFAYSVTNPFVSTPMGMDDDTLTGSMTIINNGTAESEPKWYFSFAGKLRVTVNGSEKPLIITKPGEYTGEYEADVSGGTAKYYYDYKQQNIYVDVSSRLAYMFSGSKKLVVVNQTAGIFPALKPGENSIVVELVREEWEHDGRIYKSHNQKLQYLGYNKNERWY